MRVLIVQSSLTVIYMFIFLKGYFPYTNHEVPNINPPTEIEGIPLDLNNFYQPQIQKLVLIIIDALRYDFITNDNMPYLHTNMDYILKVKVEAPTVTLPRLKALTTGAVPQFIDIVLNLGAKVKVSDSFLHRAHASGKRMVFYGDNTWLKMFPHLFLRSDGTTSFFVNDFTEVDDNVTRHINTELKSEWDMMFLHYLGLDHIGHVRGPFSSLIPQKLNEMDDVIKKIITSANSWEDDTLVMVTGDHGMKDSGGHGGTTYAETHVPLIIYHNKGIKNNIHSINHELKTTNEIIQQSDIANTISALFGIVMPAISVGKVLKQMLTCNKSQLLYILFYNSIILEKNTENFKECHENLQLARYLFKNLVQDADFNSSNADKAEHLFTDCLQQMSNSLIESSVKQHSVLLIFSMFGTLNCFLRASMLLIGILRYCHTFLTIVVITAMLSSFTFSYYDNELQFVSTILMGIVTLLTLMSILQSLHFQKLSININLISIILHGSLLASSSYIEEEHYIFYYFACTASVVIALVNYQKTKRVGISTAVPLTIIEIIRFARGVHDTKDWLLMDDNLKILKVLHIVALIATLLVIANVQNFKLASFTIIMYTCFFVCVHLHKFYFERSVIFAQTIWLLACFLFIIICWNSEHPVLITCISIMAFQLRPYNTILIPGIIICSIILKKSIHNLNTLIIIHVWLGYTFFFIQGHRNSIANIDLAPGYLGLNNYVPALVALLTLCHSYGFQTLSLLLLFKEEKVMTIHDTVNSWRIMFCYKLFIQIIIYIVIFITRGHLFIWSVFAPKLLIECMHTLVFCLQMFIYYLYQLVKSTCSKKLIKKS